MVVCDTKENPMMFVKIDNKQSEAKGGDLDRQRLEVKRFMALSSEDKEKFILEEQTQDKP